MHTFRITMTVCLLTCLAANSVHSETVVGKFQVADDSANPKSMPLWAEGEMPTPCSEGIEKVEDRGKGVLDRIVRNVRQPSIAVHKPAAGKSNGAAVVICPGGGYSVVCIDKEGHDTARWLNSIGVTAVVLTYRCGSCARNDAPRADVQQALRLTREKASEWNIDPSRVGVLGYSAGGHLASTAATHFTSTKGGDRPDFAILIYPVITMDPASGHGGSKRNLLGAAPTDEKALEYSNELRVTAKTPPTFLVHAVDDNGVKLENSLAFYRALKKNRIPTVLSVYEDGGHGFGLGRTEATREWPARCAKWLKGQGVLSSPDTATTDR